jgi:hypothetical protein
LLRKNGALIPFGGICLSAALLIDRFAGTGTLVDFFVGLFTGLAIILNLVGLYRSRKHA